MKKYYSKRGLWSLFLTCVFPFHFWTIILVFYDAAWIAKRSTAWASIGVASYGLVFAFVESLLLFFAAALLGFLISTQIEGNFVDMNSSDMMLLPNFAIQ